MADKDINYGLGRGKRSIVQIVSELDTVINSYTDETTHEDRVRVINTETGNEGIIMQNNVSNPEKSSKGKGFIVQWKVHGGSEWFPSGELKKVNGKIRPVNTELEDILLTLYH